MKIDAGAATTPSSVDQRRLSEARTVSQLLTNMDKTVTPGSQWFIVSMKWIDKWQKYTYFDLLTENQTSISEEERKHPGKISNEDIILKIPHGSLMKDLTKGKDWQNVQLKPNLKEGEDYMIVNQEIWCFWVDNYKFEAENEIQRFGIIVNEDTEEAIVEIYLKQVLVMPIPNQSIFKFTAPKTVILSRKDTIGDLMKKV